MNLIVFLQKLVFNYSDMIIYGAHEIIKQYSHFPKILPLPCHVEHGWTPFSEALESDIVTKKKLMLVYSKRRKEACKKRMRVQIEILGAPFVLYRRMNQIKRDKDATGTVAFPSHSTTDIRSDYNIAEYCKILKKLPEEYQPVTVCLHYLDIDRGRDKIYKGQGFKVVSAGSRHDINFVKRFYDILKSFKYATSNEVGSYSFYAIDLGLPFFLLGEVPILVNETGKDPNIKKDSSMLDYHFGKVATEIFSTSPIKTIPKAQKQFVITEMGNEQTMGPKTLNRLLWKYFWKDGFFLKAVPVHLSLIIIRFFRTWLKGNDE